jgi:outer membrane protein TolC
MSHRSRMIGLVLLLLSGCAPFWSLIMPEQRQLDVRDPSQIPYLPLTQVPPPETVQNRVAPEVTPRKLSLDEAIRIALANSKVIRVLAGVAVVASGETIYDPAISNTDIDIAQSVFDPTLGIGNNWHNSEQPATFLTPTDPFGARFRGTRIGDYALDIGLAQRNVLGGTWKLDYADTVSRFHPGVFPLNPEERTALGLSYTQPLLRGAGVGANMAPIVIARLNTERSYFQFKDSVQELVRGVIEAYWSVYFAHEDVAARRKQVDQAKEAYDKAEGGAKTGTLKDPGEYPQSKAAYLNFKATLIGSEANLMRRKAVLQNILGLPPDSSEPIELTTKPNTRRIEPRWEDTVRLAQEQRPDLIELELILEADQQSVLLANNQARPQVDAVMFYRWNGLEGRTPSRDRLETDFGQFTDWTLGVNFSVPLGLRKERATLRRAELLVLRDEANLEQGRHNALHTLAGNFRNLAQAYEQYQQYKLTRAAAKENADGQFDRYKTGLQIYLNVLQAISALGDAESSEAQALAQYNIELANLERETGTILETHGIRFFEERIQTIGPFGRHGPERLYPASVPPGPNAQRYLDAPPIN